MSKLLALEINYYDDFFERRFQIDFKNRTIKTQNHIAGDSIYSTVFWPPITRLELVFKRRKKPTHCILIRIPEENGKKEKFGKILLSKDEAKEIEYDLKSYQSEWLDINRKLIEEY